MRGGRRPMIRDEEDVDLLSWVRAAKYHLLCCRDTCLQLSCFITKMRSTICEDIHLQR